MWICTNCRQDIEDDFEVCWNCQFGKDGSPPPPMEKEKEKKGETEGIRYPFHWGAFFLAPLWLLFHGKAYMGSFLFLLNVLGAGVGSIFALLSFTIVFIIAFGYGLEGYKIAWETERYIESFEQLKRQQLPWNIAGIIIGIVEIPFLIYIGFFSK